MGYKEWSIILSIWILMGCRTTQVVAQNYPDQFFTLSCYSIGTGPDTKADDIIMSIINTYQKKGYDIKYETSYWGMEGESDYCFQLQSLDPKVYNQLLQEFKTQLKDRMVHIYEKKTCRQNK